MKAYISNLLLLIFTSIVLSCNGQTSTQNLANTQSKTVGGPFENGEIFYVGMPKEINAVDTSAGWFEQGQKLLITGTIYKNDGKTPAPNVVLYYYQTDTKGNYTSRPSLDKKAALHGYLRGWVKTDANGKYSIYTIRPAPYPDLSMPAHIHPTIKEPNMNEYYIDEFIFDDDKMLTTKYRKALENRGGSGVLRLYTKGDLQIAEHDIVLGLNIPNYPKSTANANLSGLQIGEDQPSFIPYHAHGPDKGTRTCPVCKYGRYHGIVYFIGNNPNWSEIKKWLTFLELESIKREKYLKAYFVYGNSVNYKKEVRRQELEKLGTELNLKYLALTFVPSFTDAESEANLNKINPTVSNTFIIYRNRTIIDKYVNLEATTTNFKLISTTLDKTKSEFSDLPGLGH